MAWREALRAHRRNAIPTEAGTALLNETGPALDRLAAAAQRVRERRFSDAASLLE
jgi:DNA-binding transcriptional LysR family regulator